MPLVWSERGAVTAEFALLLPALVGLVAVLVGLLGFGFDRVALERQAAELVRAESIGEPASPPHGTTVEKWREGRLVCLKLARGNLVPLSATQCTLPLA